MKVDKNLALKAQHMAKREYVTPEGFRLDGRRPEELRKVRCKLGVLEHPDGSAYFEQGNTKALASVYGPRENPARAKQKHDHAIIHCEYTMATFSTGERKKKLKLDRRSAEISLVLRQTFETVIQTHLYPRSQIDIHIEILQADGGTRCAAINAATLALIDAGIALQDFVCSCAAGYLNGKSLLDLNYEEDSAGVDLPVAILPSSKKVTMLQMDSKLPLDVFERTLGLAIEGCMRLYEVMVKEVRESTQALTAARGGGLAVPSIS